MSDTETIDYSWESGPLFDKVYRNEDFSPEQLLWRTVILVFLQDIQKDYLIYVNSLNGKRGILYDRLKLHRHIAMSNWLECICDFSGINYENFLCVVDDIISGRKKIKLSKGFEY